VTALFADDRYRGAHGIGRYAAEILPRLRPSWTSLGLGGSPHTPLDAFRALPDLTPEALVYSPGYGALVRAPRQVLTIHDLIQLRLPMPARWKFAAYYAGPVRAAVRRAGVVITVSDASADDIREWVRDERVRVVNAGNGCSTAFTADGLAEGHDDSSLVFVGNLRSHKNLDVVLRALVTASSVRLRAVVPAAEVAAGRARAESLGVSGRVTWLHDIDDERLAALYRGAAATVMPSIDEGFGLPALESIACGVPVIHWAGCRAVSEIVGGRGWAVDSATDAVEWAAVMDVAAGAHRRVAPPTGEYDWARTAKTISRVLESLF